ncbi:hypothetical protein GY45DRAFT_1389943 [Cubamyces sp. BRFM 1775]|nr:hypothetical protein GY45DRAFT_1389943 [Cubamyces sp. BRFM 1775]
MSDLDADLYGDLYGNDDNEFAVPTSEPSEQPSAKESSEPTREEPQVAVKSEPVQDPYPATSSVKPSTSISQYEDVKPSPIPTVHSPVTNTIPSYSSPPTQQIPTYEERQPTDLRQPPPRHDAGYQGVPGVDRPVRPSEMKEEG